MKKRLITSALPYVNNMPHLGNLIQVLSADVYARFCRSMGYETLYICGTDEYGTATETKAISEGITPQELCKKYYDIHNEIYNWFNISFDKFGRTSTPEQTEIVQSIFKKIQEAGYIFEQEIQQLYSTKSQMFLADRFVQGTCPHCNFEQARGDQCEKCGALLDPLELIDPVSIVDNSKPIVKNTKHLYIDLPKLLPTLNTWVSHAKEKGTWSKNAIKMTEAWIRDGLSARAITRDLKWGIPVPFEGYENKVFYVWFDAPIGYISITASHIKNWKDWWQNPEEVDLYQFIGKDNIPFHTVIFPASLLGTGMPWTMLHRISSTEYLNYEDGMFSKSKGIGVFGNDVKETGIPRDAWRFYMMYNRPESSDYLFIWKDFQDSVNGQLINNLSNLYNRTMTFINKFFNSTIIELDMNDEEVRKIWDPVIAFEKEITDLLENTELRQAYLRIFALSSYANKLLQDFEPWKLRVQNPKKAHWVLSNLAYIIRDLTVLIEPYTPDLAHNIANTLNSTLPTWQDLVYIATPKTLCSLSRVKQAEHLLKRLEDKEIQHFKEKFSGSQQDRENMQEKKQQNTPQLFSETVCLKVCKITKIAPHPNADKLYVLHLDEGNATDDEKKERVIVSGIREQYTIEELENKHIIVVANLKPATLRGVKSQGMLLAASAKDPDNPDREIIDVLFVDDMPPGTLVLPQAIDKNTKLADESSTIKVDTFFSFNISTNKDKIVEVGGSPLVAMSERGTMTITTQHIAAAKVG